MTSICRVHNKSTLGRCQWCGKPLCRRCIGKRSGIKLYCESCISEMEATKKSLTKIKPKGIW